MCLNTLSDTYSQLLWETHLHYYKTHIATYLKAYILKDYKILYICSTIWKTFPLTVRKILQLINSHLLQDGYSNKILDTHSQTLWQTQSQILYHMHSHTIYDTHPTYCKKNNLSHCIATLRVHRNFFKYRQPCI